MNVIEIILIIIALFIFGKLVCNTNNTNNTNNIENFNQDNSENKNSLNQKNKKIPSGEILKNIDKYYKQQKTPKISKPKSNNIINPYINDIKFHNDYRDLITAFGNIVPSQKQIFNIPNIPVSLTNIPLTNKNDMYEINFLVNDFIYTLNENIQNTVSEFRDANTGWDEAVQDPEIKSGWDKAQQKLGLQSSLYKKPAKSTHVKLIQILKVDKYQTEDEIKFVIYLVLQKDFVDDQMLLKASFIQNIANSGSVENNFFKKNKKTKQNMHVIVEELDVQCYLSHFGENTLKFDSQDFYQFDQLEQTEMIDDRTIAKELLDKHKQRMEETQYRIAMLDEEGRERYNVQNISNSQSYQATTTIFDDMHNKNLKLVDTLSF